jgi:hypothetical protein
VTTIDDYNINSTSQFLESDVNVYIEYWTIGYLSFIGAFVSIHPFYGRYSTVDTDWLKTYPAPNLAISPAKKCREKWKSVK